MRKLNCLLPFIFSLFISLPVFPNAAMPGIWTAGTGTSFYPLFKTDSLYCQAIQMKSELIKVQLFPSYAIVEGDYIMVNESDSNITMHVGYPLNGTYNQQVVSYVTVSELKFLQLLMNDSLINSFQRVNVNEFANPLIDEKPYSNIKDWYIWNCTFKPGINHIKVFYTVSTDDALIRKGYSTKQGNAFTYVFESGNAWKGVIEKGEVFIQLKGGLNSSDLSGLLPNTFLSNDSILHFEFANLEPLPENNLVIWYSKIKSQLTLDSSKMDLQSWYESIDQWNTDSVDKSGLKPVSKNDFSASTVENTFSEIFIVAIIIVPLVLGVVVIILLINFFRKRAAKRK